MDKNLCNKERKVDNPHETWVTDGWEHRVLKMWQKPSKQNKNPWARWFMATKSPYTHGSWEYGDGYVSEVLTKPGIKRVQSERVITVNTLELEEVGEDLALTQASDKIGEDEYLWIETIDFNFGIQIDIRVVNNREGPYVEGVLFNNGCEVSHTEPDDSLIGEYLFSFNGCDYKVVVK